MAYSQQSLELIQGGELIVNSQKTDKSEENRNINLLDNVAAALQLTEERLNVLLEAEQEVLDAREKEKKEKEQSTSSDKQTETEIDVEDKLQIKRTFIKLRVQPYIERNARPHLNIDSVEGDNKEDVRVRFLLTLVDKAHGLQCSTYSQALPLSWIEEESARQGDDKLNYLVWIEGALIGVIKSAVENISIDYLRKRKIDVTRLSNTVDWSTASAQIPVSDY